MQHAIGRLSAKDANGRRANRIGGGQDVHFVDNYSTMNAREDRARIMEYIMGSDDFADELAAQPAIRQKLTLMVEAVRRGFDTTGWGTPRWERPLTQLDNAA